MFFHDKVPICHFILNFFICILHSKRESGEKRCRLTGSLNTIFKLSTEIGFMGMQKLISSPGMLMF